MNYINYCQTWRSITLGAVIGAVVSISTPVLAKSEFQEALSHYHTYLSNDNAAKLKSAASATISPEEAEEAAQSGINHSDGLALAIALESGHHLSDSLISQLRVDDTGPDLLFRAYRSDFFSYKPFVTLKALGIESAKSAYDVAQSAGLRGDREAIEWVMDNYPETMKENRIDILTYVYNTEMSESMYPVLARMLSNLDEDDLTKLHYKLRSFAKLPSEEVRSEIKRLVLSGDKNDVKSFYTALPSAQLEVSELELLMAVELESGIALEDSGFDLEEQFCLSRSGISTESMALLSGLMAAKKSVDTARLLQCVTEQSDSEDYPVAAYYLSNYYYPAHQDQYSAGDQGSTLLRAFVAYIQQTIEEPEADEEVLASLKAFHNTDASLDPEADPVDLSNFSMWSEKKNVGIATYLLPLLDTNAKSKYMSLVLSTDNVPCFRAALQAMSGRDQLSELVGGKLRDTMYEANKYTLIDQEEPAPLTEEEVAKNIEAKSIMNSFTRRQMTTIDRKKIWNSYHMGAVLASSCLLDEQALEKVDTYTDNENQFLYKDIREHCNSYGDTETNRLEVIRQCVIGQTNGSYCKKLSKGIPEGVKQKLGLVTE